MSWAAVNRVDPFTAVVGWAKRPLKATPVVDTGFRFESSPAGRVLRCTALDRVAPHLFTTRELRFHEGPLDADYERVRATLDVATIARVRQVHGRVVLVVRPGEPLAAMPDADAIVSLDPDRAASVRIADCVPILIADTHRRLVAAIHAGWRGMAADVAGACLHAIEEAGVRPDDLVAAIGPCVGACCYQVGDAVRDAFLSGLPNAESWFAPDGPGHWRLDLSRAARDRLVALGVPPESVWAAGCCTAHEPDTWHSYRRDGTAAGRMVAAIARRHDGRGGVSLGTNPV